MPLPMRGAAECRSDAERVIVRTQHDTASTVRGNARVGPGALAAAVTPIRRVTFSNPHFAVSAMQVLSSRIEDFRARYRELANERAETRVARVLFRAYCDWTTSRQLDERRDGSGGGPPVDIPLSRRDLADIAGTTLYTVSRLVQDWERQGIVRGGRMRVTMLHPTSLPLASEHPRSTALGRMESSRSEQPRSESATPA